MIHRFSHRHLTWIDLEHPTADEVSAIIKEFHIHPAVSEEILSESIRPKAELYGSTIYLAMHFPNRFDTIERFSECEIDFIIGKDFIITSHAAGFDPLYEFQKIFRVSSILSRSTLGDHAGYLFSSILKVIYRDLEDRIEDIALEIKKIEHDIFANKETQMVREISNTQRRILDIKQTIRHHSETLRTYASVSKRLFPNTDDHEMEIITAEYNKVINRLAGYKELLVDLKETNDSLLSTKTNEVMKFLTFITFTTLPFTLIASILGMNSRFTTNVSSQTVATMFGAATLFGIVVYIYFRRRTWL